MLYWLFFPFEQVYNGLLLPVKASKLINDPNIQCTHYNCFEKSFEILSRITQIASFNSIGSDNPDENSIKRFMSDCSEDSFI